MASKAADKSAPIKATKKTSKASAAKKAAPKKATKGAAKKAPKSAPKAAPKAEKAKPEAPKTSARARNQAKASQAQVVPVSRAVTRLIEAGCMAECQHCEERVKFRARHRDLQVICNIYKGKVWQRVEHYHADCYPLAGEPYGIAQD
jgi:hypothetical protein